MSSKASEVTAYWTDFQGFVQAHIKQNMKYMQYGPMRGESIGERWIPHIKGK